MFKDVLTVLFQARYFREQDIDEYRECFYLYARYRKLLQKWNYCSTNNLLTVQWNLFVWGSVFKKIKLSVTYIFGLRRFSFFVTDIRVAVWCTTLQKKDLLLFRSGNVTTLDQLTVIMRSLGMSPTITELKGYMKDKMGRIAFADFLDIMHTHRWKPRILGTVFNIFYKFFNLVLTIKVLVGVRTLVLFTIWFNNLIGTNNYGTLKLSFIACYAKHD